MKRLPISAAKLIAEKYDQSQVILMTFDKNDNLVHVVSYGRTKKDCTEAAIGAKFLTDTLKSPGVPRIQQTGNQKEAESRMVAAGTDDLKPYDN